MACCFGTNKDETEPLLADSNPENEKKKKSTKSTSLEFTILEVQEFDKVFGDFARTLNPFVKDREKLEQGVAKFKTAVESLQAVRPHASFRDYVVALKTKLKDEGIFIKIKNGAVEVYGAAARTVKAVQDAISAINAILAAAEALKDMPETVATASGSSLQDAESSSENVENIIKREFPGVFDICKVCRFNTGLKNNMKKLKNAPNMVRDFCQEVKMIAKEISDGFGDKTDDEDNKSSEVNDDDKEDDKEDEKVQSEPNAETARKKEGNKEVEEHVDVASSKSTTKEPEKKKKEENGKKKKKKEKEEKKEKKKEDYQKQLKMETVGLADIDNIFTDLMTSLNKFVTTREKMQQARESFEKIMKTICNFDGEKELKAYFKELKDKAKEGKMEIYINTNNGEIKLDSVKGVDPPAPYRNAVKALNDIKGSAKETLDLEPIVERGIESCAKDVTKIEPLKDFKKLVSGVKETMALPKKVKAFNENRKKVQQAPQIVKELCLYVKQILEDIVNAFKDDDNPRDLGGERENEEKASKKDENNSDADDESEKDLDAAIQAPGAKTENTEENDSAVAC